MTWVWSVENPKIQWEEAISDMNETTQLDTKKLLAIFLPFAFLNRIQCQEHGMAGSQMIHLDSHLKLHRSEDERFLDT